MAAIVYLPIVLRTRHTWLITAGTSGADYVTEISYQERLVKPTRKKTTSICSPITRSASTTTPLKQAWTPTSTASIVNAYCKKHERTFDTKTGCTQHAAAKNKDIFCTECQYDKTDEEEFALEDHIRRRHPSYCCDKCKKNIEERSCLYSPHCEQAQGDLVYRLSNPFWHLEELKQHSSETSSSMRRPSAPTVESPLTLWKDSNSIGVPRETHRHLRLYLQPKVSYQKFHSTRLNDNPIISIRSQEAVV